MTSLSVIIPSYKRYEILEQNLYYLDSLEIPKELEVEFIIAVNACHSSNYGFLKKFKKFKAVFFEKQLPIGESMLRAAKLSKKDYVYLLGDDDVVAPFFFYSINKYLNKNYSCIHFKKMDGYGDNIHLFDKLKYDEHKSSFCEKELRFDEFLLSYNLDLGFISSVIFKRSLIELGTKLDSRYFGYDFLAPIYFNKEPHKTTCFISAPLIIQRHDFNRAYNSLWPYIFIVGARNFIDDIFLEYGEKGSLYNKVIKQRYTTLKVIYNILWFNSAKQSQEHRKGFFKKLNRVQKLIFVLTRFTGTKWFFPLIRIILYKWK